MTSHVTFGVNSHLELVAKQTLNLHYLEVFFFLFHSMGLLQVEWDYDSSLYPIKLRRQSESLSIVASHYTKVFFFFSYTTQIL
ncbi:hypothetical protein CROQUDRAFT_196047 [Cronartium quercuum f. sp. fusiforme G11]|uniref:Uncharacterized protein n=1 Tax=Cronartium quercuum f. sp. fusiforme G11 TaxID=708437 RepID=A0A9P6TH37_9BASI|nr:hypothetical protein CROQUDRAFT_196047 [Cronartium quercuum f. sp. fusiforme G11]